MGIVTRSAKNENSSIKTTHRKSCACCDNSAATPKVSSNSKKGTVNKVSVLQDQTNVRTTNLKMTASNSKAANDSFTLKSPGLKLNPLNRSNINNEQSGKHVPIYMASPSRKRAVIKPSSELETDKNKLYEFEVDENEPKTKKRRKIILKIKKVRPRKKLPVDLNLGSSSIEARKQKHKAALTLPENVRAPCTPGPRIMKRPEPVSELIPALSPDHPNSMTVTAVVHCDPSTSFREMGEISSRVSTPAHAPSPIPVLFGNSFASPHPSTSKNFPTRFSAAATPEHFLSPESRGRSFVYASTPVKFYDDTSIPAASPPPTATKEYDVSNCFGFEEEEPTEEPLMSPIKSPQASGPKQKPEKPPIQEFLKALKDKSLEPTTSGTIQGLFTDDLQPSKTIEDFLFEPSAASVPVEISEFLSKPEVKAVPRKSYERPKHLRRVHFDRSFAHDSDVSEDETVKSKAPVKSKKKHGPTKKEEEELEKWAKEFNSQCNQIDKFDLVIE